jgi:2,4-diketo-3-deoxy-L-fuconate hydrolase
MIMTRIIIGLAAGCFLTILNIYPIYAGVLPPWNILNFGKLPVNNNNSMKSLADSSEKKTPTLKMPEDALTLSRFSKDGQVHILAVLSDNGQGVSGIDLSVALKRYDRNAFDVIKDLAFDDVVKIIRTGAANTVVRYQDLLPSVAGEAHLAIGINYAEHGKETGQVKPFMFPKIVKTHPAIHELDYEKGWLLDHEVELGIVFPSAVCAATDLNHSMIGFLVVNDFTDRATLMRKMDSQNVTGGKGFPDAKSKKGFLPTGPYMVVPRNWRAFVKELHLTLSVNGHVRQSGYAKDMVWNIDKIIEQSLLVKGERKSYRQDKMVKLFEGDCIPANSIIITGTPSGVVFNAPTKGFIFGAVAKYIFTGGFFSQKMHPYILQQYLKKELSNPRYLKPGDHIETSINFLGSIKTSIKN